MYRFTAESLPYHDYSLPDMLRQIAGLGFTEVNLWSSRSPLASHVNPGDDLGAVRRALDTYGLSACGLTMYGHDLQGMLERIELARELGIDRVVFDCEANFSDFVGQFLPPLVEAAASAGVKVAVENHLTVPFTPDFEAGGNEDRRWDEGVDSFHQIKRLIEEIDHPNLGVCLAPPHLWVMQESISEVITWLAERKKLFYYYLWDIDRNYRRGVDGLNFGPGELQLPRPGGTLDHAVPLETLRRVGYSGVVSLKCHGTRGWELSKVTEQLRSSRDYIRECLPR
jgi:sugar phosphate isomerase/epimerase